MPKPRRQSGTVFNENRVIAAVVRALRDARRLANTSERARDLDTVTLVIYLQLHATSSSLGALFQRYWTDPAEPRAEGDTSDVPQQANAAVQPGVTA